MIASVDLAQSFGSRKLSANELRMLCYMKQAADIGCPLDQVKNFIKAGLVLQHKQLEFARQARLADNPDGPTEIGYGGGLGGGKTHTMMSVMGADDCQRYPGLKCLLLRKHGGANKEGFNDMRIKVYHSLPHRYGSGKLTFDNGSTIIVGHFQAEKDIDKYLGLEYDVIAIEEATTLSDTKYRYIGTRCRTSKPGWRPRMYSTTNPGGVGHAWYRATFIAPWRAKKEKHTRFIQSLARDNCWNNADYVPTLERLLVGWERRAWLEGDWDIAAGQFFTTFRHDRHVFPNAKIPEFDYRRATEWSCALDYGFRHFTAVPLGCRDADGNWWILDMHMARRTLPGGNAAAIKAMLARHQIWVPGQRGSSGSFRPLTLADLSSFVAGTDVFSTESDGKTIAQQYEAHGIKLAEAVTDRINGWAEIQGLLGDEENGIPQTIYIHKRCSNLIDNLPLLQHDPDRPEDVLKVDVDERGIGGDDGPDSVRYLVMKKVHKLRLSKLGGT